MIRPTAARPGLEAKIVAAQIPVRIHVFGWPASAWTPHATPAATRPARVGLGRRSSGRITHGAQAYAVSTEVHSSFATIPPPRTATHVARAAPDQLPARRSPMSPAPSPAITRCTIRVTSRATSGSSWKISQFGR